MTERDPLRMSTGEVKNGVVNNACQPSGGPERQLRPYCFFSRPRIPCARPQKGQPSARETKPFLTGFSPAYCHSIVTVRRSRLTERAAGMAGWQGETTIISTPPNPTTPHPQRESGHSQGTPAQRSLAAGLRRKARTMLQQAFCAGDAGQATERTCWCRLTLEADPRFVPVRSRVRWWAGITS